MKLNSFTEKLPHGARLALIFGGILIGILLIIFPTGDGKKENTEDVDDYFRVSSYTESLEERIRQLCLSVDGIDNVSVLLTLESGTEHVYADNVKETTGSSNSYSSDYLVINNGSGTEPVPITEIYPKIRGVAVVCDGGDEATVQVKLTELLSAALGLASSRIKICG